jgi:hypothetical protein
MTRLRAFAASLLFAVVIGIAYLNIWTSLHGIANIRPRSGDELVILEDRYRSIRETLLSIGYTQGPVRFITKRELNNEPPNSDDDLHWVQGQYVFVPWILVRNKKAFSGPEFSNEAPWVIGDFWDGAPSRIPEGLIQVHDTGNGLILFQRKSGL